MGHPRLEPSPPSNPPTPPSTPLSPPNTTEKSMNIPTSLPQLPNISITRAASPNSQNAPQNLSARKTPLDLGKKPTVPSVSLYTNGVGLNLSQKEREQMMREPDSPGQYGPGEIDVLRSKMADLTKMAGIQSTPARVSNKIFLMV